MIALSIPTRRRRRVDGVETQQLKATSMLRLERRRLATLIFLQRVYLPLQVSSECLSLSCEKKRLKAKS